MHASRLVPSAEVPGIIANKFRPFEPEKTGPELDPVAEESMDDFFGHLSIRSDVTEISDSASLIAESEVVVISSEVEVSALTTLWIPGLGEVVMIGLMVSVKVGEPGMGI